MSIVRGYRHSMDVSVFTSAAVIVADSEPEIERMSELELQARVAGSTALLPISSVLTELLLDSAMVTSDIEDNVSGALFSIVMIWLSDFVMSPLVTVTCRVMTSDCVTLGAISVSDDELVSEK